MDMPQVPLRAPMRFARPEDGRALAELVNFAGEGLPLYVWTRMAGRDGNPWAIGAERQARRSERGEIIAIDEGNGVVAAMTGYPILEEQRIDRSEPIFSVLQELENAVVGTWYLNVLATYPQARGRGFATLLIRQAEELAASHGLAGVSIVVADTNLGARRLYARLGYAEGQSRPMVKEDWESEAAHWMLMEKRFDPR